LPNDVPSFVVSASILPEVILGRLVGGVCGSERQIGEEGAIRTHPFAVIDHSQQLVDEVFAEVISVRGSSWWFDVVVVDH
jgi:hypothetical protein